MKIHRWGDCRKYENIYARHKRDFYNTVLDRISESRTDRMAWKGTPHSEQQSSLFSWLANTGEICLRRFISIWSISNFWVRSTSQIRQSTFSCPWKRWIERGPQESKVVSSLERPSCVAKGGKEKHLICGDLSKIFLTVRQISRSS